MIFVGSGSDLLQTGITWYNNIVFFFEKPGIRLIISFFAAFLVPYILHQLKNDTIIPEENDK